METVTEASNETKEKPYLKWSYTEMLVSSVLSLIASFVLSVEAIRLVANPAASFFCDISEKISCSRVGASEQANLFGFPNAFFGMIAEPVVITIAVALLARVSFPRWFLLSAQAVYSAGLAFALWLFYESYFNIGALCPWCLLVTVTTLLVFASLTRVNILHGNLPIPTKWQRRLERWCSYGADTWIVTALITAMAVMIITRYL